MDVYSTALQGMYSARAKLYGASALIANGDIDQYAGAFVEMMRAKHAQSANVKVLQTQQRMDRSLLDIFA